MSRYSRQETEWLVSIAERMKNFLANDLETLEVSPGAREFLEREGVGTLGQLVVYRREAALTKFKIPAEMEAEIDRVLAACLIDLQWEAFLKDEPRPA